MHFAAAEQAQHLGRLGLHDFNPHRGALLQLCDRGGHQPGANRGEGSHPERHHARVALIRHRTLRALDSSEHGCDVRGERRAQRGQVGAAPITVHEPHPEVGLEGA